MGQLLVKIKRSLKTILNHLLDVGIYDRGIYDHLLDVGQDRGIYDHLLDVAAQDSRCCWESNTDCPGRLHPTDGHKGQAPRRQWSFGISNKLQQPRLKARLARLRVQTLSPGSPSRPPGREYLKLITSMRDADVSKNPRKHNK